MNSGHANVGDQLDRVSHQTRGHHGLFGHWQVAGAGADHGDSSLAGSGRSLHKRDGASSLMKLGARLDSVNGFRHFTRGARSQHVAASLGHACKDYGHLFNGFARSKDYLRYSGRPCAVMVEFGEANVLEGQILQTINRVVDRGAALANFVEQNFDKSAIHQSPSCRKVRISWG